jgi:hypothetical protein
VSLVSTGGSGKGRLVLVIRAPLTAAPPPLPRKKTHSAIVVTLIATAIVPLALKPGQEASDRIFEAKQKAPLDNKTGPGKPKKSRR